VGFVLVKSLFSILTAFLCQGLFRFQRSVIGDLRPIVGR